MDIQCGNACHSVVVLLPLLVLIFTGNRWFVHKGLGSSETPKWLQSVSLHGLVQRALLKERKVVVLPFHVPSIFSETKNIRLF